MENEIHITSKDLKTAQVVTKGFAAEVNPDYCLVELGNYTFKITPEHFRVMGITCELANQLRETGDL